MPLITCPDCAAQVSDAAPACPGCGRPVAASAAPPLCRNCDVALVDLGVRKKGSGAAVALVVVAALVALFGLTAPMFIGGPMIVGALVVLGVAAIVSNTAGKMHVLRCPKCKGTRETPL